MSVHTMANSVGYTGCLAITLLCALPACGSSDASSASGGITGGGRTGAGGSTTATGGGTSTGGAGGLAGGGAGGSGAGGSAGTGGSSITTGGSAGAGNVDLTGTWIANVQTPGVLSVPTLGDVTANLGVIVRLVITTASGTLDARFDVCKMTVVTTPDPNTLTVTFTPAVLATLTTSASESAPVVQVGGPVPIPTFTILSGITASGASVDADADGHPGVTLPGVAGNLYPVNVYAGLTVQFSLSTTLSAMDTLSGTAAFTANGTVFGSDSLWITNGNIGVTPVNANIPITAKLLAGDVPCADVLTQFP